MEHHRRWLRLLVLAFGLTVALNAQIRADGLAGVDCGARINAADAALGAAGGEIYVTQACGTSWTTPVSLSPLHVLHLGPGTYQTSATVSLGTTTALVGACRGNILISGCTVLKETPGANVAVLVTMQHGVRIENIFLGGAQDTLVVLGAKAQIYNVGVEGARRDGIVLGPISAETKFRDSSTAGNGRNGLELQSGATDVFAADLVSVNNALYQIHGGGTIGGLHFTGGDFSGLTNRGSDCVFLDGSLGGVNFVQFSGGTMLNCGGNGIKMINANMGSITGMLIGNVGGAALGVSDAIQIINWGPVTISGNTIVSSVTNQMRSCVNIIASSQPNMVSGNGCLGAMQ